jgi:RNA polymerase sigma factor (sigma-70 family)
MQSLDDMSLLREYAANNSEAAFAELVSRRVGFVYAAALRQVRDPHLAEEITQAVFIILAQKAGKISGQTILAGWLFKTTRYAAIAQTREIIKRRQRELEVQMQSVIQQTALDETWEQMSPLLDEALASLGETDRQAVLLRFFENKSLAEVGSRLGTGEDTARKRVARALEKLHRYFNRRGVSSTTAILAGAMSANSVSAAPVALAKSVTAVALAKGAAASGSTLTLIKGALKIMAWTKMKTAVVVGVGVLLAAGITTITIKEIQEHRTYPWQEASHGGGLFDSSVLDRQPPQVRILQSRFTDWAEGNDGDKIMGTGLPAQDVVAAVYDGSSARMIFSTKPPGGRYDFIGSLPNGNREALEQKIKRIWGVVGKNEMRDADVMLLKVKPPHATSALKRSKRTNNDSMLWQNSGTWLKFQNQPVSGIAHETEALSKFPIIDETGLTNNFDFDLNCKATDIENRNWDNVNQALDPLGLELVPSREPIEMLVVEKVK